MAVVIVIAEVVDVAEEADGVEVEVIVVVEAEVVEEAEEDGVGAEIGTRNGKQTLARSGKEQSNQMVVHT